VPLLHFEHDLLKMGNFSVGLVSDLIEPVVLVGLGALQLGDRRVLLLTQLVDQVLVPFIFVNQTLILTQVSVQLDFLFV